MLIEGELRGLSHPHYDAGTKNRPLAKRDSRIYQFSSLLTFAREYMDSFISFLDEKPSDLQVSVERYYMSVS